jgi:uncharacterized membrane protein
MPGTPVMPLRIALATTLAAIGWMILWETVVAPLRPGGSLVALKCVPLVLCVPGLLRGARRARQWLALLLPWYFAEALVRAMTSGGRARAAAVLGALLAAVAFTAVVASLRIEHPAASRR